MRKFIGWIETILGFVVVASSIITMLLAKDLFTLTIPSSISIPIGPAGNTVIEGASEIIQKIFSIIPIIVIAYSLMIFLIGVLIFLEGLSKVGNEKLEVKLKK